MFKQEVVIITKFLGYNQKKHGGLDVLIGIYYINIILEQFWVIYIFFLVTYWVRLSSKRKLFTKYILSWLIISKILYISFCK